MANCYISCSSYDHVTNLEFLENRGTTTIENASSGVLFTQFFVIVTVTFFADVLHHGYSHSLMLLLKQLERRLLVLDLSPSNVYSFLFVIVLETPLRKNS